jgi:ornithine cyclodeaminase
MVAFLDVASMSDWIRNTGLDRILCDLVGYLEEDFRRWPEFDKAARVASHSPIGVIELMPTSDGETYGFKYVNGHPGNPVIGRQTVTPFGVLADVQTGYPTFWSEMTILTALRTAATSVMAARALARPDSTTMALIGTGSQAEFQALAFRSVLGVNRLQIWDIAPEALAKFVANMDPLGFDVVIAGSAADAVADADVITTCTADKMNATVLQSDMVTAGVHINAIGGDCPGKTELEAAVLGRAEVFVEFEPQTRIEGEIQQVPADFPVTELWQVLTGSSSGRTARDQITVFDSVGFAVEDFAALRYARDATQGTAYPRSVDLIAEPANPKNLFALLTPVPVPA